MAEIKVVADQVFPVLESNILVDGFHIVIDLEKSHGTTMVDARTGKEYIDCYCYFASLPIGHNHPGLCDEGFLKSLTNAAIANPANSDVYTKEFAGSVKTFREVATPDGFRYLFFVAGGSLAVENAMKVAFDWKRQLNRSRGVEGGGDKILHFVECFHGRTGYTMSCTNTDPAKVRDFPQFEWPRISNPKLTFPVDEAAVTAAEGKACAEIEAAFAADPHGIAAILIEPIQGEGGDNHFRPEFMQKLREYADRFEALLIFDEVQTGIGSTGTMWAFQQTGIAPDIIAFGKKTQVCGIMSTERVDSVPDNVFHVSSRINSTWGGNLVDMVRSARYLEIIRDDDLVANAARVGEVLVSTLSALAADFPFITNVRGRGLFAAFDLPEGDIRNRVRQAFWDAGLATLVCGPRSIRFRPSLIFSEDDVARADAIMRDVLAKTPEAQVVTTATSIGD